MTRRPTSDQAKRIAAIFRRRLSTSWTKKEVGAFCSHVPYDEDELAMVERYYRVNWPPRSNVNALRHDLATFINNYPGEVDRARAWTEKHPVKAAPRKIIPLPRPPEALLNEGERTAAGDQFERLMGRRPKWERQ